MLRRHLLAVLAAGLAAPNAAFADDVQRIPLTKAFRYLDAYLDLPPALRSRFHLVFRATLNERPAPDVRAVVIEPNGARMPLALDAQGQVERLPTLPELKSGAMLEVNPMEKFRFATEMRPDVPPSTRIDVASLDGSLAQANAAIARLAGGFSVLAPKLDIFLFPDAGSGQAQLANGRIVQMPTTSAIKVLGVVPYFEPHALPGAKVLTFARTPSRIILAQRPKG